MKVYITADIEGINAVDHWNEATIGKPGYENAARRMTEQVLAAAQGALGAGADYILVQDAHDSGRNILPEALPEEVEVLRGWSDDPRSMAQELDASFDALVLLGQHAPSGSGANPLSHTFSPRITRLEINGKLASEYTVLQYTAALFRVPVVFLSGDSWVAAEAQKLNPALDPVVGKTGTGASVRSVHPGVTVRQIRDGVRKALQGDLERFQVPLPASFNVRISYLDHAKAFKAGFYPGVRRVDDITISFRSKDFWEVLRFLLFTVYGV